MLFFFLCRTVLGTVVYCIFYFEYGLSVALPAIHLCTHDLRGGGLLFWQWILTFLYVRHWIRWTCGGKQHVRPRWWWGRNWERHFISKACRDVSDVSLIAQKYVGIRRTVLSQYYWRNLQWRRTSGYYVGTPRLRPVKLGGPDSMVWIGRFTDNFFNWNVYELYTSGWHLHLSKSQCFTYDIYLRRIHCSAIYSNPADQLSIRRRVIVNTGSHAVTHKAQPHQ